MPVIFLLVSPSHVRYRVGRENGGYSFIFRKKIYSAFSSYYSKNDETGVRIVHPSSNHKLLVTTCLLMRGKAQHENTTMQRNPSEHAFSRVLLALLIAYPTNWTLYWIYFRSFTYMNLHLNLMVWLISKCIILSKP